MISCLFLAIFLTSGCFSKQLEGDLKGDANIYTSVVLALKELKLRQLIEEKNIQQGEPVIQRASSVCYDELGCFDKNGTFKHLKQLPEPPETVNTQFLLYTKKNPREPQLIDYKKPETILNSNINPALPLKFITHGFGGKNNLTWVWNMKTAFLEKEDVNIIVVDWSLGARVPYYIQAAVNSELVGAQIAVMYYFIKDKLGIEEKNMHVIGFSLGAQVAGFSGKRMMEMRGTKPGRITGLDPASPLFEDYGGEVHLFKDDADFVDVVHTNADLMFYGGVGIEIPIGHVDYYPNGGKRQPGCGSTIKGAILDMFKGERERTCNHERAVHLFTDSILNPTSCKFTSYPCESYSDFELGKCMECGKECGNMGYRAKGSGTYFLMTKATKPYCAELAKLKVTFANNTKKSYGSITLTLIGSDDEKENVTVTQKDEKLVPGDNRVFAITLRENMKPPKRIEALYLKYDGWFTKGKDTFGINTVHIQDTQGKTISGICGTDIILKDKEYQTLPNTC